MNTFDLYPHHSVRPGAGQASGTVQTTTTAASTFQIVRTLPLQAANAVEYARINLIWIPQSFDGVQIAFGKDSAAALAAITTQPVFISAHGILRFLMQPNDTGFVVQSTGTGTDNLYYWVG